MKKLLLIAAASTAFLSSASFAECDMNAPMDSTMSSSSMENQWYAKINAGGAIFNKLKVYLPYEEIGNESIKLKSKTGFVGEIGGGYYIMNNLRTDLTVGFTTVDIKKTVTFTDGADTVTVKAKANPTIVSFLLNGYVDFVDLSMFKVFAGGGVGAAILKEKGSSSITGTVDDESVSKSISGKDKNKTNFTYQLSLGTSFEVADGVKAELVYSWRDYGKSRNGLRYRSNNLMAGLRFDM